MKKLISLLLVMAMLFAVAACTKPASDPTPSVTDAPKTANTATEQPQAQTTEPTEALVEATSEPSPEPAEPVRVAALAGPTGIGLTYVMQDMVDTYSVELFTAPDQVTAKIINGEVDIAAVPVNLASVLYNKTEGKVAVIAVNTLGVLYFLENGETIQTVADLAGKTVYSTGLASTPQYILEQILAQNNLSDSVKVEYLADNTELIGKLASGDVEVALLPEPHVSVALAQAEKARVALSANDLWKEHNDAALVQGVYIVRKAYLEEHKDAVDRFLADANTSAQKVLNDENAAAAVVAQGIIGKEPIAKRAIPNCNIVLESGAQMKTLVSAMLETLWNADAKSVGGKLPADDFYYVP